MRKLLFASILAGMLIAPGAAQADVCLQTDLGTVCQPVGPVDAHIKVGATDSKITFLNLDGSPVLGETGFGLSPNLNGQGTFHVRVDGAQLLTIRPIIKPFSVEYRVQACVGSNCSSFTGISAAPGSGTVRFYPATGGCTAIRYSPTVGVVPC